MIIDIHLEVLDESQKGDTKLIQENFFEILVQEFMRSEFIKEENVPKNRFQGRKTLFLRKRFQRNWFKVQISDLGRKSFFLRKVFLRKVFLRTGSKFRFRVSGKEGFFPKEQVPSLDSGFREGRLCSYRRCS
ncbi:SICA antigen [Plasmodium coatneyi]|uniref:SICA antigen n=1 Tax=Plasmodium coatneyi TaxID=208452 RepID=A0A1B1E7W2_9APIC|nr:SICA antigen [Plasmodium coatneyi]ANQ11073.1 SICA antigen [Plasmodium coatneyi]